MLTKLTFSINLPIYAKTLWAIPIIDKSQFFQAIAVIDKLSPINFSDKRCGRLNF